MNRRTSRVDPVGYEARPGLAWSAAAALVALITTALIAGRATSGADIIGVVAVISAICWLTALWFGDRLGVAVATAMLVAVQTLSLLAAGGDRWLDAGVIGVLLYVGAELAWEAIVRRSGVERTPGWRRTFAESRGAVISTSIVIALIAAALSGGAPTRTLPVQAAVVAVVLGGLMLLLRSAQPINQKNRNVPTISKPDITDN